MTHTQYRLTVVNGSGNDCFPSETFASFDDAMFAARAAIRDEHDAAFVGIDREVLNSDGELTEHSQDGVLMLEWRFASRYDSDSGAWHCVAGGEIEGVALMIDNANAAAHG